MCSLSRKRKREEEREGREGREREAQKTGLLTRCTIMSCRCGERFERGTCVTPGQISSLGVPKTRKTRNSSSISESPAKHTESAESGKRWRGCRASTRRGDIGRCGRSDGICQETAGAVWRWLPSRIPHRGRGASSSRARQRCIQSTRCQQG
jgi:hypothetical protein